MGATFLKKTFYENLKTFPMYLFYLKIEWNVWTLELGLNIKAKVWENERNPSKDPTVLLDLPR